MKKLLILPTIIAVLFSGQIFAADVIISTNCNSTFGGAAITSADPHNHGTATTAGCTSADGTSNITVDDATGDVTISNGTASLVVGSASSTTTVTGATTSSEISQTENTVNATVTNSSGTSYGLEVSDTGSTLSGGSSSTTSAGTAFTLDNTGATFANAATGAPALVHGVADGVADYDAVNVRQLDGVKKGVAISNALDAPSIAPGHNYALNVGLGYFDGETAIGLTGRGYINKATTFYAGIGTDVGADEIGAQLGLTFQF